MATELGLDGRVVGRHRISPYGAISFASAAVYVSLRNFAPVWFPFSQHGTVCLNVTEEIQRALSEAFSQIHYAWGFSAVPETLHALSQFFSGPSILTTSCFPLESA